MSESDKTDTLSFLPNFCSAEVLFIVILSAELLAIILSFALPLYARNVLFDLALNSLFIQWIALSCVGVLCMIRRYIILLSELWTAAISYLVILLIALIITELAWQVLYVYPGHLVINQQMHGLFLLRAVGISAIVGAVVLRYLYVQHQWRKNIEVSTASRFQALQSRIRPHFLFNCMNTIASLIRKSPDLAEQSIEDLADLFRASLLESTELYKITEEWIICETYLRIERHRLGDRLKIHWNIESLPKDALVVPLSLQPLLENMIYHGIEQLADGGEIEIKGELNNGLIHIHFINPVAAANNNDVHKGNKLAQENIRQRLDALFGKKSNLIIHGNEQKYIVTVMFPYKRYENTVG